MNDIETMGRRVVYRIKNEENGQYYRDTQYLWKSTVEALKAKPFEQLTEYDKRILSIWDSPYKYDENPNNSRIMIFDHVGKLYSTERGAQNMCSQLTKCSYKDRKSKAGMILKAKYNFRVVRTEVIFKDHSLNEANPIQPSEESESEKSL